MEEDNYNRYLTESKILWNIHSLYQYNLVVLCIKDNFLNCSTLTPSKE